MEPKRTPLLKIDRQRRTAILSFNRPDSLNTLGNVGDGDEVAQACAALNDDPGVKCVIITGEGRAFSAGGDLKAMQAHEGTFAGGPVQLREQYRRNVHRMMKAIHNLEVPVIAAVAGPAIGLGCDVACLADVRIAASNAKFAVSFLKVGLIPGDGGAWLLPRTIGASRAAELLFTGAPIDAETALSWGLVSRVVEPAELMAAALALAEQICAQPAHALRLGKSLLKQSQASSFEAILEMSAAAQAIAHTSEDHAEGVAALVERRPPRLAD